MGFSLFVLLESVHRAHPPPRVPVRLISDVRSVSAGLTEEEEEGGHTQHKTHTSKSAHTLQSVPPPDGASSTSSTFNDTKLTLRRELVDSLLGSLVTDASVFRTRSACESAFFCAWKCREVPPSGLAGHQSLINTFIGSVSVTEPWM